MGRPKSGLCMNFRLFCLCGSRVVIQRLSHRAWLYERQPGDFLSLTHALPTLSGKWQSLDTQSLAKKFRLFPGELERPWDLGARISQARGSHWRFLVLSRERIQGQTYSTENEWHKWESLLNRKVRSQDMREERTRGWKLHSLGLDSYLLLIVGKCWLIKKGSRFPTCSS